MDKFNRVLDLMDEIIEREIEIEHVFDITKAELVALHAVADAAQAALPYMWPREIAEKVALANALDALDKIRNR